jgi:hypothetical protein
MKKSNKEAVSTPPQPVERVLFTKKSRLGVYFRVK